MPEPSEECVSLLVLWDVAGASEGSLVAQWLSPLLPGQGCLRRACVHSRRWINVLITDWELG